MSPPRADSTNVAIYYVLGTDGEQTRAVGEPGGGIAEGRGAVVQGAGRQHAVAEAALVEGSEIAVALCGAKVRVWPADAFPYPGADSDAVDQMCLDLVAAARSAATADAERRPL